MKKICFLFAAAALLAACSGKKAAESAADAPAPMKVIFETDMGNDVDDALAYDMLIKYAEQGKIDLLGISSNKPDSSSVEYLDILNTWYGHEIPLGHVVNGA